MSSFLDEEFISIPLSPPEVKRLVNSLPSLKRLILCNARMDTAMLCKLSDLIERNETLKELYIYHNPFYDDEPIVSLANALKSNTSLRKLVLEDDWIGFDGTAALAEMLCWNSTLVELGLASNSLGNIGSTILANFLPNFRTLKNLDLTLTDVGAEGAIELCRGLCHDSSTLQVLKLAKNNINFHAGAALGRMLKSNSTLRELDLFGNELEDEGARMLVAGLGENSALDKLNLSHNGIGDATVIAIAEKVLSNSTSALSALILESNLVQDAGMESLARALVQNNTLRFLSLANNHIGSQGAASVGRWLPLWTCLEIFHLQKNHVTQHADQLCLVEGLKENRILTKLALDNATTPNPPKRQDVKEISEFYLQRNLFVWALLQDETIGSSIWPFALSFLGDRTPSLVFFLLTEKPSIVQR